MGVFQRIFIEYSNAILQKVLQLWSMFSPVRTLIDPNKWCFVIVAALEAGEHDPNSDHCTEVLREIGFICQFAPWENGFIYCFKKKKDDRN